MIVFSTNDDQFKRLKNLGKLLSHESDALTNTLKEIEKELNALGLGIDCWTEGAFLNESMPLDDGSSLTAYYRLGYGRYKRSWGLLVHEGVEETDVNQETYPLVDAKRHVRVAAVNELPKLINELLKRVEKLRDDLRTPSELALQILSSLRGK